LGPQFIVEVINGDETTNRKAEEMVKKLVARAKKEGKKLVLISKDMASRSFSIPEIDTVILMFDRGSYSTISQKIARVLTPGKTYLGDKKTYGNIISLSLDPNREDISPIDEYLVYESEKVKVDELSDGIKRVLRSVNIFMNNDDELQPIEVDSYVDKLISSTALIKLGVDSVKVDKVLSDSELVKILTGVEVNNSSDSQEKLKGINSSKVIRTKEDEEKEKKEVQKKLQDLRTKLKEVLSNIVENVVEISEINNCESDDILQTMRMIREKGYDEEVVFEVGVNTLIVEKVLMSGAISVRLLNTIITSYNKQENSLHLQYES
jgi:superfamily II DNA or RNA helicase